MDVSLGDVKRLLKALRGEDMACEYGGESNAPPPPPARAQ